MYNSTQTFPETTNETAERASVIENYNNTPPSWIGSVLDLVRGLTHTVRRVFHFTSGLRLRKQFEFQVEAGGKH